MMLEWSRVSSGKMTQSHSILSILLIMKGFVVLSASTFIYFTNQILDDGLCDAAQLPGLQRDPNKQLRYAQFIKHFLPCS